MVTKELLLYLRQRLLDARSAKNQEQLKDLQGTFYVLQEAIWSTKQYSKMAAFLDDMIDSVRDSFQGVEWKSEIPSIEAIERLNTDD
ncbi:MAG: hypothetical protein ABI690_25860 [Chloroflexota bacterium]